MWRIWTRLSVVMAVLGTRERRNVIYFVIDASKFVEKGAYRRSFAFGIVARDFDGAVRAFKAANPEAIIHAVVKRGTIDLIDNSEIENGH